MRTVRVGWVDEVGNLPVDDDAVISENNLPCDRLINELAESDN
jgi:hypothetical protein